MGILFTNGKLPVNHQMKEVGEKPSQSATPKTNLEGIEDNQLVIFDMKNISRGCVVKR